MNITNVFVTVNIILGGYQMFNRWALMFFDSLWFIRKDNKDPLDDPIFLQKFTTFLTGKELASDPLILGENLKIFRSQMMPIIKSLQENIFDTPSVIELLNNYMMQSSGNRVIIETPDSRQPVQIVFEPDQIDAPYVLAELAHQWYILFFEMDRTRIHICELPDCQCLFYDESKNHSKRHCSPKCGNRMKVRRHREKKRCL